MSYEKHEPIISFLEVLCLPLLHHVSCCSLRAFGLSDVTEPALQRAGYFPSRSSIGDTPDKLSEVVYEGLVNSSAGDVHFMVAVDQSSIEGDAFVLAEDLRDRIHVHHDLNVVRRAGFACFGIVDGAAFA